jgi:hypothetical protein
MTEQYEEGDTIEYATPGGERRVVRVDLKSDDIKNGRPGFDGTIIRAGNTATGQTVWGYDDQIVRVVARKEGRS